MDLLQLKYFQTVARHEHMTRAAAELYIAQPSLSKVISRLEEDLGVSLFDRKSRQIKLNAYGEAFLKRVNRIFLELDDAKRELADLSGNEDRTITMAINNLYPISKMLRGFIERYPAMNTCFRQTMGSTEEMRLQLLSGEVDFCVSSPPIQGDNIECIHLFSEEIYLLVPHGHKFSNRRNIDLIEAIDEPFISLKSGFGIRDLTEQLCMLSGFKPRIVFESEVALNLIDMVNCNMGIALLPILDWDDLPDNIPVPLHINNPTCSRATALSYLKGHYLTHVSRNFIDYQMKYFQAIRKNKRRQPQ